MNSGSCVELAHTSIGRTRLKLVLYDSSFRLQLLFQGKLIGQAIAKERSTGTPIMITEDAAILNIYKSHLL